MVDENPVTCQYQHTPFRVFAVTHIHVVVNLTSTSHIHSTAQSPQAADSIYRDGSTQGVHLFTTADGVPSLKASDARMTDMLQPLHDMVGAIASGLPRRNGLAKNNKRKRNAADAVPLSMVRCYEICGLTYG